MMPLQLRLKGIINPDIKKSYKPFMGSFQQTNYYCINPSEKCPFYEKTTSSNNDLLDKYNFSVKTHYISDDALNATTIIARHKMTSHLASLSFSNSSNDTDTTTSDKSSMNSSGQVKKPTLDLRTAISAILLKYETIKPSEKAHIPPLTNHLEKPPSSNYSAYLPTTAFLWFSNHLNEWYSQDKSKFFSHFTKLSDLHLYFSAKGMSNLPYLACTIIHSPPHRPLLYFDSIGDSFPSQIDYPQINMKGLYLCFSSQPSSFANAFFSRLSQICINSNAVLMRPRSMYASQSVHLLKTSIPPKSDSSLIQKLEKCPYREFIKSQNNLNSEPILLKPDVMINFTEQNISSVSNSSTTNDSLPNDSSNNGSTQPWNSSATSLKETIVPVSYPFVHKDFQHFLPKNSPQACLFFTEVKGNCGIFIPELDSLKHAALISIILYEKCLDPITFDSDLASHFFQTKFLQATEISATINNLISALHNTRSRKEEESISSKIINQLTTDSNSESNLNGYRSVENVPIFFFGTPIMPTETCQLQFFEPRHRSLFMHSLHNKGRFGWVSPSMLNNKDGTVGVYIQIENFGFISDDYRVYVVAKAIDRFVLGKRVESLSGDSLNFGLDFHDIHIFYDDPPRSDLFNESWVREGLEKAKFKYSNNHLELHELSFLIEDKSSDLFLSSTSLEARLRAVLLQDNTNLPSSSIFNRTDIPI